MPYLHYQHSSSNFIVARQYNIEYFDEGSDEQQKETYHHYSLLRIINLAQIKRKEKLEGLIKRIYVSDEEAVKYANGEENLYSYDPLDDTPELYLEMNKIKIFDEKSLMKFIENYGIPFDKQLNTTENEIIGPIILFPKNETIKLLMGMDVFMFYEELLKLQNAIKMWTHIKEENVEQIKKIVERFRKRAQVFINKDTNELSPEERSFLNASKKSSELVMTWEEVKNSNLKEIAVAFLNLELKQIKSGETSTRFINDKIVPAISFNNLVEVAGYQLKQAIFKNEKLQECIHCGSLFEPRHAAQKFCSPLPGRKRSTCENTYNQRRKRLRKKQRKTGNK